MFFLHVSEGEETRALDAWESFPTHSETPKFIVAQRDDRFLWGRCDAPFRTVAPPDSTFSLFNLLILKVLERELADTLFLHGNALIVDGRLVLLVGDSGAGKSTLSALLLEAAEAHHFAEDTLLIDHQNRRLLPFPRGASKRTSDGKVYEAFRAPAVDLRPTDLTSAIVFLLRANDQQVADAQNEVAYLTSQPGDFAVWLQREAYPPAEISTSASSVRIEFAAPLTVDQRAGLSAFAENHQSLLLRSGAEAPQQHTRAQQPSINELPPSEAVARLLSAEIRHTVDAPAPAQDFMRLAKSLSTARFFDVIAGGQPEDTMELLRGAIAQC